MKKSNDLDVSLKKIQSKTGLKLSEIAESIKKAEETLSRLRKGDPEKIGNVMRLLEEKYGDILKERILDTDKVLSHDAMISVLVAEVAALRSERTGEAVQSLIKRLYKAGEDAMRHV